MKHLEFIVKCSLGTVTQLDSHAGYAEPLLQKRAWQDLGAQSEDTGYPDSGHSVSHPHIYTK